MGFIVPFLIESVFQVVTWVVIGLAIGGIFYFAGKDNWRGVLWSCVTLVCAAVIMLAIVLQNHMAVFTASAVSQSAPPVQEPGIATTPFSVAVEASLIMDRKSLDSAFCWLEQTLPGHEDKGIAPYGTGKYLSPVSIIMMLRIVNLQNRPSLIERYTIEMQAEDSGWVKLIHMDARRGQLFIPKTGDFKHARPWDVTGDGLDYLMYGKAIQAGDTVRGWILFEIPGDFVLPKGTEVRYRIYIKDTGGAEYLYTTEPNAIGSRKADDDLVQPKEFRLGPIQDVSGDRRIYYSQTYSK